MHNPLSFKYEARVRIVLSFSILVGLILFAVAAFPPASRARRALPQESGVGRKRTRPAFVPGEVLVRYRSEAIAKRQSGTATVQTSEGTALPMQIEDFGVSEIVTGLRMARVAADDTMKAISALKQQPDVLYAEPNYILHADLTPNDPSFGSLFGLTKIGAPTAWNTNTGSSSVVVGVIDQGIDINHEDLQPNVWTNPAPGLFPPITGDLHGVNFINNTGNVFSGDPTEDHASHVAGIVGARGNNGIGVVGVNWTVGLMSLKFLDAAGSGDTANAVRAVAYAKQMRDRWVSSGGTQGANVRVLNNSYGGGGFDQSFLDAINGANTSGILFVAAAGNVDVGTEEPNNEIVPHYPSSFDAPNVVAVASTTSSDNLSGFSHFGSNSVDLGAPGSSILSTTPGNTYQTFSGTSMATPHVSGAAALLWAQNPNLTVQQVKNLLLLNGDIQAALIDKTVTGRRLNVANSFQSLAENDTTPPGTVGGLHINRQNGRSFNLGWSASGDDGSAGQASLYQLSFTDATTGDVIPLKSVVPMGSGSGQVADVKIPLRHTSGTFQLREFDNVGNEGVPAVLNVGVPLDVGDPYVTAVGPSAPLTTGGTRMFGATGDDDKLSSPFSLGFSFPFFGSTFQSVIISTNGNLFFSTPPTRTNGDADDVPSSTVALPAFKMISGLWDDLYLGSDQRSDAGVFITQSANQVIFRWQGVPCNSGPTVCLFGGAPVNFEIELRSDGTIKSRYGSGNTMLFPVVGIAGGERDAYVIPSHTSEEAKINLTNAGEVTYTPRAQTVSTLQFQQSAFSVTEGTNSLNVQVTRLGDTTSVATVDYTTSDTAGANPCSTVNGVASSRCDYLTTLGTLRFAAGDTTKTISIPVIDDVYAEGSEDFTITLANPTGAVLGAPSTATLTINNDSANGTSNPIDVAGFFVRQHYVDFLNREPDASGLNFWTNEITQCGADAACTELKRINVSGAFFLSIEFQETGYLVYRMYKSGFGNLAGAPVPVRFNGFLRDTQQIGQGVQVGVGNWQAQLEANKQAFALDFVQRPEFLAAFSSSLSADQFVTQLATNAGITFSSTDKANLLSVLGGTPADVSKRASVLRAVAEDATLKAAEFNKAFVLMQYFGYLRRNPNDAPDSDFSGYNFWLSKLNQFNGNFVNAEMVKAFITSIEYRRRFAP